MIDSHCHLDLCAPEDSELVATATAAGVEKILTIGITPDSCRAAVATAEAFPQVWTALGRHPNESTGFDDADLADLASLAAHPRCVAIGETGWDFFRNGAPRADQERAFRAQIELARETDKALVVHSRDAARDTVATLAEHAGGVRVIIHCFAMPERLDECVERGWWISFAGNVTYPRSEDLREAARRVRADRLLVETDAPFLTAQSVRKERNHPALVVHTARAVAEERSISYEELERTVEENAAAALRW